MKQIVYEIYTRVSAPAHLGPLHVQNLFESAVATLVVDDGDIKVEKVRVAVMYPKRGEEAAP